MKFNFPLLRDRDIPYLPIRDGGCLVCCKTLAGGAAYLSAGSVSEILDKPENTGESTSLAFFQIHYHSNASDVSGSAVVDVVDNLHGGQFDLTFCSTQCLRKFFQILVDELESKL